MLKFLLSPGLGRRQKKLPTPNKTYLKCRDNDERPAGKKSTIEWEDGEKKKDNSNLILTEIGA